MILQGLRHQNTIETQSYGEAARGQTTDTKMAPKRIPKWLQKWSQNGSKIDPEKGTQQDTQKGGFGGGVGGRGSCRWGRGNQLC